MKFSKKQISLFVLLLLTVIVILAFAIIRNHYLVNVNNVNRLVVAIDSGSLGYAEMGDSVFGLQYEIVKAFADSMNMELLVVKQNDVKASIEGLLNGEYDIVASLIPTTTEWIDHVDFTIPLLTARQVLVQRIDTASTTIKQQYDLANDTIYVRANSPQIKRIANLSDEIADTIHIVEINGVSPEQMIKYVAEGRYKYTISNERLARKMQLEYPNLNISLPVGFEQSYCWAVHSESKQLLARLNTFLETFIDSHAYWEIYRKYN